jgi:tetratricopeptide (TPR) repeat protein
LRPAGVNEDVAGVVNVADLYERSSANKALYKRAKQEMDAKSYKEAIATFNQLTTADPADYWALSDLGMLQFIQKDYEAAEKSFAAALTAKPDHFPALLNQGRVQMARNNYEGAAASLEAAIKADPKSASANFFLGETYLQLKKGSKAVVSFNAAIALDPVGMADAHLRLGALYNGANLKDRAATEYEAFLKVKPDYPERKKLEDYIAANKKP